VTIERGRRSAGAGLLVLLAILAAALATATPAAACVAPMPTSEVTRGMTGTGWTVTRGRTREPFNVEVLGVLKDGVGPGRDMIVVQASGPAITAAGGIWYGMSGSPVYIGGRFAGALAFGFSAVSDIAGLTPGPDMTRLLSLRAGSASDPPDRVVLPRRLARTIAARTGAAAGDVDTMTQLRIPLSVSGLNARGMRELRARAEKKQLRVIPFSGSAAAAPQGFAAPAAPEPGDNFAAAASYGDVTFAGVGTTSWSCGDQALAFGHPFFFAGDSPSGANAADAFGIVRDQVFGPFKFASVAEPLGTVDQDRLAGLRAHIGRTPPTRPIRSFIADGETGAHRSGRTDVVQPELMPFVTFFHLLSNFDSTHDEIGRGTAELRWTIEGTRADGSPWRLTRGDLVASRWDIAIEASDAVAMDASMLGDNFVEDAQVKSVSVEGSVDDSVRQYTVTKILVAKGRARFKAVRRSVVVEPGMLLRVRSVLKRFADGSVRNVDFRVRVPRKGQPFGMLQVAGGRFASGGGDCEEGCEEMFSDFDALLKSLQKQPRSDELTVRLRTGSRGRIVVERKIRLDGVIFGGRSIMLRPAGGDCCEGGGPDEPEG
jgi:hypothetical protein